MPELFLAALQMTIKHENYRCGKIIRPVRLSENGYNEQILSHGNDSLQCKYELKLQEQKRWLKVYCLDVQYTKIPNHSRMALIAISAGLKYAVCLCNV